MVAKVAPSLKDGEEDLTAIFGDLDPFRWLPCFLTSSALICLWWSIFYLFRTLLIHGLESDWIEEEMADDDDFRLSSSLE